MARYLVNAFSLNMITHARTNAELGWCRISKDYAAMLAKDAVPAIGHADTAAVVGAELGLPASPFARITVVLESGDECLVAQYQGPRLSEGATALPDGATIDYHRVELRKIPVG